MRRTLPILFLLWVIPAAIAQKPVYRGQELVFPGDYREWVYLSSGLGMTYGPAAPGPLENPMFDTVFVSPEAFRQFKESGVWPEGAIFVLEIRYSTSHGSINKGGFYQTDVAAIEVNVKDARFPGGFGFFDFGGGMNPLRAQARELGERGKGCRACHSTNGAVESTFTQFYPTALAIAQKKGTVKSSFQPPAPSPTALLQTVREQGWSRAEQLIEAARAEDPHTAIAREPVLNRLGYALLSNGDGQKAVEVFRYAAGAFPASANAQDSLAEAYERMGRTQEALAASRKALALLDQDTNMSEQRRANVKKAAADRIERLGK